MCYNSVLMPRLIEKFKELNVESQYRFVRREPDVMYEPNYKHDLRTHKNLALAAHLVVGRTPTGDTIVEDAGILTKFADHVEMLSDVPSMVVIQGVPIADNRKVTQAMHDEKLRDVRLRTGYLLANQTGLRVDVFYVSGGMKVKIEVRPGR